MTNSFLYTPENFVDHFLEPNFYCEVNNSDINQGDTINENNYGNNYGNNHGNNHCSKYDVLIDKEKTKVSTLKGNGQKKNNLKIYMNDINIPIYNNNASELSILIKDDTKEKKKCGRKRILPTEDKQEHNKFSDDNLRRKCKHLVIKSAMELTNNKIKEIYNGNIGKGIFRKELQTLNQSQKSNATINYNKDFLTKTLKNIFSEKISSRITNLLPSHNKLLIEKLLNEEDENKRIYFNKLFNINFIQCLNHFIGKERIYELEGLKCFNEIKDEILKKYTEDGQDYIESLEYYLQNYEDIIYKKRSRKSRK